MSWFLAGAGIPVAVPSSRAPAVVQYGDGHVMSFWEYLEPSAGGPAREATIGSMLRELHAALRSYRVALPVCRLGEYRSFWPGRMTRLEPADVAALGEAFATLAAQLAAFDGDGGQALHGDAGAGNLMATGGQFGWHDFEDTCRGPIAWDLAASTASPYRDRTLILAAYEDESVDAELLGICEQLRRLHLTVWYCVYAERLPECRSRAAELLASWRDKIFPPGLNLWRRPGSRVIRQANLFRRSGGRGGGRVRAVR